MRDRKTDALVSSPGDLLRRLMLAEVIARRGEGPLAPRFKLPRVRVPEAVRSVTSTREEPKP